ncbi:hypothetical protein TrRE_jg2450, partial [Triparma retinervis]
MAVLGGSIAYWRFPRYIGDGVHPHPLPDVIFDLLPSYCPKIFGQNIQSIVLLLYYLYLILIVLPFHPRGRVTLQRFLILNSLMFLTRTTTVSVTSLPQPNFTHKCLVAQNTTATFAEALKVVVGTKFPPKACGDLIYSGHASCAIMAHMIFRSSRSFDLCPYPKALSLASLAMCCLAVASIFLCRSHYTVDVVLAGYFSAGLLEFYFNRAEGFIEGGDAGRYIRWMEGGEWGEWGGRGPGGRVTGRGCGGESLQDAGAGCNHAPWVRESLDDIGYKDKEDDGNATTDTAE